MGVVVEHRWQTCQVADCETCQSNVDDGYVIACDGCIEPGHADADGWVMDKEKLVYCSQCAREQAVVAI